MQQAVCFATWQWRSAIVRTGGTLKKANRRDFLRAIAAGASVTHLTEDRGLLAQTSGSRRQVTIGGRRIKVIDIHAHCVIPVDGGRQGHAAGENRRRWRQRPSRPGTYADHGSAGRRRAGADDQRLLVVRRRSRLARRIVRAQNEGLAKWVAAHPDRFVALASVALQHPDLAAEQLEDGVKRLGLRGASIGGHVNGEDLSLPKYDPFWAKAAELGVPVFMHPGGAANLIKEGALGGRGDLGNIIGNPLETTYFLSRLIFDGTLDKFPGLRVCAAHAGGYLPSYLGRTEAACIVAAMPNCANKKKPSEYLKSQIFVDTMVFSEEGLRHLVAEMGVGQIVYGTDVPFNWPVTVDLVLDAPFLSDVDKVAILSGNLMKLLRIAA